MKNRLTIIPLLLLTVIVASCSNQSTFTISGALKNPGSIKSVYLLQADSTQISIIDSTKLSEDGKFHFKHPSAFANLYELRVGGTIFDLIAKNGDDIDFSTDLLDTAHNYTITGSQNSAKIQEFNRLSNVYDSKTGKINADYMAKSQALGHESDSLAQIFMPVFEKNFAERAAAVLSFVHSNSASLAAFYAMMSLDPTKYEQQMVAYADSINADLKTNPAVKHFIHQMNAVRPVSIGHKAPEFTIGGIDGKHINLADYKGKYVMLDFWASWCAPCRAENPNVVKQYALYKDKGLNILGISLDVDKAPWQQAIGADKLTWAQGSDLKRFEGPTEALYHIEAIPSNFMIDPQGVIVAKNVTGNALKEFLNKTFNKAQ